MSKSDVMLIAFSHGGILPAEIAGGKERHVGPHEPVPVPLSYGKSLVADRLAYEPTEATMARAARRGANDGTDKLAAREAAMRRADADLAKRENALAAKAAEIEKASADLAARENTVKEAEDALAARENALKEPEGGAPAQAELIAADENADQSADS